jgi:very-short-patch-repair endonuclease
MAAVLACGEGAVLSHRSAASLWALLRPVSGPIDVSVPSQNGRRKRTGIRLHRCASLASSWEVDCEVGEASDRVEVLVTLRKGIPVTSVARTISDLRGSVPQPLVRRATRQAELMGMRIDGVVSDRTRSDLERDFLRLCRRHGLPRPEVNVKVGRWKVDFLWPAQRLAVETDSWGYHRGSVAFEDDHARDLELRRRGYQTCRYTERQICDEPGAVAADLAARLHRSPAS